MTEVLDSQWCCTECNKKFTLGEIINTKDGFLRCPNGHEKSLHMIDGKGHIGQTRGTA